MIQEKLAYLEAIIGPEALRALLSTQKAEEQEDERERWKTTLKQRASIAQRQADADAALAQAMQGGDKAAIAIAVREWMAAHTIRPDQHKTFFDFLTSEVSK